MTAHSKGYRAEWAFITYLRANGWPDSRRPTPGEHHDMGDVIGTPGLVWEVRNRASVRVGAWSDEAAEIAGRTGADFGIAIIKPHGVGTVANWLATFSLCHLARLMAKANSPASDWEVKPYERDLAKLGGALMNTTAKSSYALYDRSSGRAPTTWADYEDDLSGRIYALLRVYDLTELLWRAGYGTPVRGDQK